MQKTILLTGSNGFTGRYVKSLLIDAGYRVIGLVQDNPGVDEYVCELTDKKSVFSLIEQLKPNGLIHLAALAFVGHADQESFYSTNLFGTLNLLEAFENTKLCPDKIIIASSANIYGSPNIEFISENVSPSPMNHYAMSKLAMEHMVKLWFHKFNIVITRPFNYTGVGQSNNFVVPKIVAHFSQKKQVIELGNLDVYRDFSDVRDIARAYVALYQLPIHSEVVNLCSGQLYSLRNILSMMEDIAGYQIDIRINPAFVRENEIARLGGSFSKLNQLVGFKPQYNLNDTLSVMYQAENKEA